MSTEILKTMANITKSPKTRQSSKKRAKAPNIEAIGKAAYYRYIDRGGMDGYEEEDWLEAEKAVNGGWDEDVIS